MENGEVFVRDHNLFLRELATTNQTQLTTDGCATNSYARNEQANRGIEMQYELRDPEANLRRRLLLVRLTLSISVAMRHQPGTDRRVYLTSSRHPKTSSSRNWIRIRI